MLTKRLFLDGTQLKLLALLFMLIDHIHYFFEFTGKVPGVFFVIGRLSAYLFLFCMVEGFSHTRSRIKYFLRVYMMAVGMGIIYHLMSYHGLLLRRDGFYPINGILLNLVILCIIWQGIDWVKAGQTAKGIIAVFLPFWYGCIAEMLISINSLHHFFVLANHSFLPNWGTLADGGLPYIVVGIVLYIFKDNRKSQCIAYIIASLSMQVLFRGWLWSANDPAFTWSKLVTDLNYCQWLSVFTVVFFFLYNGKKGRGCKQLFYWFYPIHVYVLYFFPAFAIHCIHNSPKSSCYLLQSQYTEVIEKIKATNKIQNRYTAIS